MKAIGDILWISVFSLAQLSCPVREDPSQAGGGPDARPPATDASDPPQTTDASDPPQVGDAGDPPQTVDAGGPPQTVDASSPPPDAGGGPGGEGPTAGWTPVPWNADSYYVQNRSSAPMSERFWIRDGVYTTQVLAGEERVEMRWDNWPDQKKEHMWDGDVMFEPGTSKTCIMQIKSNEDGEPIYIQVFNSNGDIRNDGEGSAIGTSLYGKWFNLKAAFNPSTGVGRAWINNVLVKTRQYRKPTSGWYFKNGTYNNGIASGQKSVAHFKNIRLWRRD